MGAGYLSLSKKGKRQQRKVGREEEESSSNRPERAAFVLALRVTLVTKPMLYLCDNQALLKAVKRWVSESVKATLVARRRHFTASNRNALNTNNSKSSDVSSQGESVTK